MKIAIYAEVHGSLRDHTRQLVVCGQQYGQTEAPKTVTLTAFGPASFDLLVTVTMLHCVS